jgi:predicted RNA-binding Zn-ribbon protein involved in translation (DUF1610 family)
MSDMKRLVPAVRIRGWRYGFLTALLVFVIQVVVAAVLSLSGSDGVTKPAWVRGESEGAVVTTSKSWGMRERVTVYRNAPQPGESSGRDVRPGSLPEGGASMYEHVRSYGFPFCIVQYRTGACNVNGVLWKYHTYHRLWHGTPRRPLRGVLPSHVDVGGMIGAIAISFGCGMSVTAWVSWRRARRVADQSTCRRCGYDAGRAAGTCPECGFVGARGAR